MLGKEAMNSNRDCPNCCKPLIYFVEGTLAGEWRIDDAEETAAGSPPKTSGATVGLGSLSRRHSLRRGDLQRPRFGNGGFSAEVSVPRTDAGRLFQAENQTCEHPMDPAYELLDAVRRGRIRALSDVVFELGVDEAEALRLLRNAVSHAFVARDYTHLSEDFGASGDGRIFRLTATGRMEWERLDGEARS